MKADLLVVEARIHTLDDNPTTFEALACLNGRIIAIGASKELQALIGPATTALDLDGRTVLPGFIDAHEHLSWFAEEPLKINASVAYAKTLADLTRMVRDEAVRIAPGEWVCGVLYGDTKTEGGELTREELDRAAPANPVIIVHVSGHWAVVNSAALAAGGLTDESPNPKGGEFDQDPATGRLNGHLVEMAMFNFAFESLAVTPTVVPPFAREVRRTAVKKAAGETIGADEKITLLEAFRMHTAYAAYASGEEIIKGRLSLGMLADMVVLEKDPWGCHPEEISNIGTHRTIVGGRTFFISE